MSRSYKKVPIVKDGSMESVRTAKRLANQKVRRKEDIPLSGGAYKKYFNSWDIHDFKSHWNWEQAKAEYLSGKFPWLNKRYPTLKEFYRGWYRCNKGK